MQTGNGQYRQVQSGDGEKMNKSKNINPRICRTCGKCCKWFSIPYDKAMIQSIESQLLFSDLQRFLELQTDLIYVVEYEEEFSVIFDIPCMYLRKSKGVYSCKIYRMKRPLMCEKYPYKLNDCEKFVKPINTFKNSADFLQRVNELVKVGE